MINDRCTVLLGVPIDDVTLPEALDRIAEMVTVGRATGRVHQIATVNVDFVVNANDHDEVRSILQRTDLSIPDGMGIVWGSRFVNAPIRERTSGADLVPALAERTAREGWRLCLFGAAPGVAEQAAELLRTRYPGADVVGVEAPAVAADGSMDAAAAEQLRELDADVIGVALGNPKQEQWIVRWKDVVGAPVYIGIGGSLDFLTGVTRRAPAWMQRGGLEWIHRAGSEPRRLAGRYAKDLVVYGPGLLAQAWRGRRRDTASVIAHRVEGDSVVLDLTATTGLDNVTAAQLVGYRREAKRLGRSLRLVGVDQRVRDSAARLGMGDLLADAT
jgi:N-acetylglucosaminyldiphosphoundecaprenol N-acetyl-beta-D-mannosaminyltransferase